MRLWPKKIVETSVPKAFTETTHRDTGELYRMYDCIADKYTPVMEYPNDKVAQYGCSTIQLPPYAQAGDFKLIKIGRRDGNQLKSIDPVCVWTCEGNHEDKTK